MGAICCKAANVEPHRRRNLRIETLLLPIHKEKDIVISPSSFVKRNKQAFFSIYKVEHFPLGSGARGEVRICTHIPSKDRRVVKIISKASLPLEVIESATVFEEVKILKNLDHPNLPRIYEFFEDDENFYIVLEFCKGGDLFDRISELKRFNENQAIEIMSQLLAGVNYLHSKGIVHRDLKPENILMQEIDSFVLKIIDFDTATFFRKGLEYEMLGTPLYMAPEILRGKYDEKCDLWSCGMIFYILLAGGPPFDGTDEYILERLKKVEITLQGSHWDSISPLAKDLLLKLLETEPTKRISAAEACLHPWLTAKSSSVTNEEVHNVLTKIRSFKRTSKLKEAIHTFIISKIVDPKQYRKEQEVFKIADVNKDGSISKSELANMFKTDNLPTEEAEMWADSVMEQVDSDLNGSIDFTEFLRAAVGKKKVLTKENLYKAFQIFDQDGNGTIDAEELRKCLSGSGYVTTELLVEIMNQADRNGDGLIDLSEFEGLLLESITSKNTHEFEG